MKEIQRLIEYCRLLIKNKKISTASAEQLDKYVFAVIAEHADLEKKLKDVYSNNFGDLEKVAHLLYCFGITDATMLLLSIENLEFISQNINKFKNNQRLNITQILDIVAALNSFKNMHERMPNDLPELRHFFDKMNSNE